MRVVLAPAAYDGWLDAGQVAEAMRDGWRSAAPGDDLDLAPLSDGGPGFLDVVHRALGGDLLPVQVQGPDAAIVPGAVLVVDGPTPTAYVEVAQAVGRHLVPDARADPTTFSSYGAGELLAAALATGARRIVVGVGGTAVNDGGAGLLAALGAGRPDRLSAGGLALASITPDDLADLEDTRARLRAVDLVVASATDVPLLGLHGTSASYAEGKGATPEQAQRLEASLGHFAHLAARSIVAGRPLVGAGPASQAGAGSGGGIGFALLLLGAVRVDGVEAVCAAVDLDARIRRSQLTVTGESSFDWESLAAGPVRAVSHLGLAAGVPVVVVAGQVPVGRRESMGIGVAGAYPIGRTPEAFASAVTGPADAAAAIAARTARVARTWSRG